VLRRDLGTAGPVQNLLAGQAAVYGVRLSTGVPGIVIMQAGGAAAQLILVTGIIYNVSVLEALAVLDGFSAAAIFSTSTTDGITAADPFSGLATATRTVTDSITGLDNLNRSLAFNLAAADSISGSDNINGDVDTPGVVAGSLTESLGASDAIAVQWTSNASVTGSITALDAGSSGGTVSAAVTSLVTAGGAFNGFLSSGIVFNTDIFDSVFSTDELTVEYFSGEDPNLKLTLAPILSLYRSAERLNSNFEAVQEAFQNTLSRDGTEPNNMLVELDMDSNRIINLGAPVDDNDAVRLIDLQTFGGGGGGTVSLPTNLTFSRTPTTVTVLSDTGADATLPSADGTNAGVMSAADKAKLDSVQVGATDDQTGSEIVTAINGFLGSTVWQSGGGGGAATNLTFSRTIDTLTVLSDTGTDATLPEATNLLAGVLTGTNKGKLDSVETGATKNQVNFVVKFGGVGDGVTSNNAAIAAAEASSNDLIYIPEGVYLTTLDFKTLAKKYVGPGRLVFNGSIARGYKAAKTLSSYVTDVSPNVASEEFGLNQTGAFTDYDYRFIPDGKRVNFDRDPNTNTNPYFWAPATPHFSVFDNLGGASGVNGRLAAGVSPGATTAPIVGLASDWNGFVGRQIGFSSVTNWTFNVTDSSSSNNTLRIVGNLGAKGVVRGTPFKLTSAIGGLAANTTYWVLTVVSSAPTESFFTVSATPIPSNPGLTPVSLTNTSGQIIPTTLGKLTSAIEPAAEIVTITSVNAAAGTFSFTPALQNAYIISDIVLFGYRTMNAHQVKIVDHGGRGDAYAYLARVSIGKFQAGGAPLGSETGTFDIATGGIIGGSMSLISDGRYATGWECVYDDNGYDGAVIGQIESYVRTNNTATRKETIWLHNYAKMDGGGVNYASSGLKPLDGVYVASVAARTGLDFTKSRFSVGAVALPLGERILFDAETPEPDVNGQTPGASNGWGYVASITNNMWLRGGSDGVGKFIQLRNQNNYVYIRPDSNQFTANTDFSFYTVAMGRLNIWNAAATATLGSIYGGTDGTGDYVDFFQGSTYRMRLRGSNGTLNFNGSINAAGDIAAGLAVRAPNGFYINTNVYIYWDGTNLRATKNAGSTSVIIV
jgi:hypothetical protein